MADNSSLSEQNDVVLGGGEENEVKEVRVSESVDEAKEGKIEAFSGKDSVFGRCEGDESVSVGDSGAKLVEMSFSPSLGVGVGKEDLAGKEIRAVEDSGAKFDEMRTNNEEEDLGEKERNGVEDSVAKLDGMSDSKSVEAENEKEDLAETERNSAEDLGAEVDETRNFKTEKDKEDSAEKERNLVGDLGVKLDETSGSKSLEADKEKEDLGAKLDETRGSKSLEADKEKDDSANKEKQDLGVEVDETARVEGVKENEDSAEKERDLVEDSGAEVDETVHVACSGAKEDKRDSSEMERQVKEPSCLESLEAEKDRENKSEKELNVVEDAAEKPDEMSHSKSLETEKDKKELAEKETNTVEDSVMEVNETSHLKSLEAREENKEDSDEKKSNVLEDSGGASADETTNRSKSPEAENDSEDSAEKQSQQPSIVIDLNPKKRGRKPKSKSAPPPAKKTGLNFGDLVWGKVRSHPWWPGQICDPSSASPKAKKYFKKDAFLVAYYGDNSFAWNEASRIKPFLEYYPQMSKQSSTEDFGYAIDCVLEELSRRVELSLACTCLVSDEELFPPEVKSQTIVNAGVRGGTITIDGGDKSLTAASFEPGKLVGYVRELARDPNQRDGKLGFAMVRSELLAFSRRKGYSSLPGFTVLGGISDENGGDVAVQSKEELVVEKEEEDKEQEEEKEQDKEEEEKEEEEEEKEEKEQDKEEEEEKEEEKPVSKRKLESNKESPRLGKKKKKKSLSDLAVRGGQKKRKASVAVSVDPPAEKEKPTPPSKQSFRVGERISKVASQLNGPLQSPILKNANGDCKKGKVEPKKIKEAETESEAEQSSDEMSSQPSSSEENSASSDEDERSLGDLFGSKTRKKPPGSNNKKGVKSKRSKLSEPEDLSGGKTGKKSLSSNIKKEGESKRSKLYEPGDLSGGKAVKKSLGNNSKKGGESKRSELSEPGDSSEGKTGKKSPDSSNNDGGESKRPELSELPHRLGPTTKSYWSDRIGKSIPENQDETDIGSEEMKKRKNKAKDEAEDESEYFPTALVLKFADSDSVPSKESLNKIFGSYESLDESKTELLKNSRAQVVFGKRSDAETAFSSSGKYSAFGPGLVSYRLKHLPSSPAQSSKKRSKKNNDNKASQE